MIVKGRMSFNPWFPLVSWTDLRLQEGARPRQAQEAAHGVLLLPDGFPRADEGEDDREGAEADGDLRGGVEQADRRTEEAVPGESGRGVQDLPG